MASQEVGVGLVGIGAISPYYVNAVKVLGFAKLVAVCDVKVKDSTQFPDAVFYTDFKQLVDDPRVDVVIIATPPSTHFNIIEYSMSKKKKVIVEKPVATSVSDAEKSVQLSKDNNTHLYFSYHTAFQPVYLAAKEVVNDFVIKGDKVKKFSVHYFEDVRNYHPGSSWVFNPQVSGGGCLIDSGINALSAIVDLLGPLKPSSVHIGHDSSFPVETEAKVSLVSESDSDLSGELEQNWLYSGTEKRYFHIEFHSGSTVSFDFVTGKIITTVGGVESVVTLENREGVDTNLTPMSHEYINIVKDAFKLFGGSDLNNSLGLKPFQIVMDCYKMSKNN
eukprot:TRINITY_DN11551_c0_g1_i1.p1 TRINITY_DN11551_c0_g1~~TRINITY_DN11551_c0_g1_i1.p1  ORF type:complete len:333 (+),score=69.46 TRINITY_DN11551_c0_g1_i1:94-1092(+)